MQKHLNRADTINLGSFYTPKNIVNIAYDMLEKQINLGDFLFFDSSCGYGDFFTKNLHYLGADIDSQALKSVPDKIKTINTNSLLNVSRKKFGIKNDTKLVITRKSAL